MLFGLFGCAAQRTGPEQTAFQPAVQPPVQPAPPPARDWWLASPSAELPKSFPPPGPLGEVVVKEYPAYREAVVQAGNDRRGANGMFYPLFDHIRRNSVPMSAPVEMQYAAPAAPAAEKVEPVSMAFVYPEPTVGKTGPDREVTVVDIPAMTVLSVTVRGSYTGKRFQTSYEMLTAWLKAHADDYQVIGPPRYLAYNSPFVLPMFKLGEVQVPVQRKGK